MYDIAYLTRGKLRREVLRLLERPKTATMLGKELSRHRSSISRILLELEERGFVKCLNPKDVMHRFYQITPKGEDLLKKGKELEIFI